MSASALDGFFCAKAGPDCFNLQFCRWFSDLKPPVNHMIKDGICFLMSNLKKSLRSLTRWKDGQEAVQLIKIYN